MIKIFQNLDRDEDGKITSKDIKKLWQSYGKNYSSLDLKLKAMINK